MTDVTVAATERRRQPAKQDDKPKRMEVRGKLRCACDRLVYEGMTFDQAARSVGFSVQAMRKALERSHVLAYIQRQREVLRASMCGANLLALADVRDQRDNQNARVAAVNALERLGETNNRAGSSYSQMPGFTVVLAVQGSITGAHSEHMREIEAKPLITQGRDILHENMSEPGGGAGPSTGEAGRGEKSGRFARSPA